MLDTPIDVESGVAYWLVVKGVRGDASVCVGPQQWKALGEFLINRGGQRWKPISDDRGMSALIRPIYSPDVDHQTAAVEIEVQADARVLGSQRIDPWADVRRLSLPVIGDKVRSASLVIKSSAAGSLTLANVVQRYTH